MFDMSIKDSQAADWRFSIAPMMDWVESVLKSNS
jgi:hypothetical protein